MNKKILLSLKIIISGAILAYLFTIIPLQEILIVIKSAEIKLVITAILIAAPINYLSAFETHYLTKIQGMSLSVLEILKIHLITSFYGLFLPGVLSGGAVKWYKFSKHGSKSAAAAVVVFNRFLELLIIVLIGILFSLPALYHLGREKIIAVSVIIFLASILIYFSLLNKSTLNYIKKTIGHFPLPNIIKINVNRFIQSLYQFQSLRIKDHLEILGLLLLYHGLGIISFYCFAKSLDINLNIWTLGWIRSAMSIAIMLPFSFAGFGIREGTLVFLLSRYNVPPDQAMALSLLIFTRSLINALIGGIFEMYPSKNIIPESKKKAVDALKNNLPEV